MFGDGKFGKHQQKSSSSRVLVLARFVSTFDREVTEFPFNFPQGYVVDTYIPWKLIEFWGLEDFSHFSVWDDEQPVITVRASRTNPHDQSCSHCTVECQALNYLVTKNWELQLQILSLCCSSACHCHTQRTSSSCSLRHTSGTWTSWSGMIQWKTALIFTLGDGGIVGSGIMPMPGQSAWAVSIPFLQPVRPWVRFHLLLNISSLSVSCFIEQLGKMWYIIMYGHIYAYTYDEIMWDVI